MPELTVYKEQKYTYRIKFANKIMVDKERNKGEQRLHYKIEKWKKAGTFDIQNSISEHAILVQLMD